MKGRRSRLAWLFLAIFWLIAPKPALAFGDCPLVGALENFDASAEPQITHFDAREVEVSDANGSRREVKKGEVCQQRYTLKEGAPALSGLEIMQNYAQGLPALGLKITNAGRAEDDEIYATMIKDGVESWAHVWESYGTEIRVETLTKAAFQSSLQPHAASDCPVVSTLEGFSAGEAPVAVNYDAMEMHVVEGDEEKTIVKKGKVCKQRYVIKEGAPALSGLEIMQNYAQGLSALGLKITNAKRAEDGEVFATMTKDGVETWAHVWESYGTEIRVETLQIEPFKSSMKAPQAAAKTPAPPAKARLIATATRDGKPVAGAWCGAFAPGAPGGEPIVRADSGKLQEIAPGTYDIGCFVAECGAKAEGWLRNQALAAGDVSLSVDTPAPRVPVALELQAPASAVEPVVAESGDFPYLPPVPGSAALGGKALAQPFYVQPADAKQPELVAEKSIEKDYRAPQCVTPQAIGAGYADALQKSGWTIVNQTSDPDLRLAAHFGSNGRNIWASISANASGYALTVADATVTGAKIAEDLNAKCHLALTGVLFDFAKSTLKPESDAILGKVAEALATDPALKLEVEGHTDNVGSDAYNDKLSLARAKSVVKWLEANGVEGKRLKAHGYGKTRPIADNDSDEGRAKNRRVELANSACKAK
jgi:outer membrane protein OmpA-like peptidoglycan-associated protein